VHSCVYNWAWHAAVQSYGTIVRSIRQRAESLTEENRNPLLHNRMTADFCEIVCRARQERERELIAGSPTRFDSLVSLGFPQVKSPVSSSRNNVLSLDDLRFPSCTSFFFPRLMPLLSSIYPPIVCRSENYLNIFSIYFRDHARSVYTDSCIRSDLKSSDKTR